ncbi:hypothetical protein [Novosphingobium sp. ZW T3_23]|uniref:hypothetical protein n=1 Tax=Novosphingobium sp. ZW T3_23 TaxID=3378084 RepID=UPI0038532BDC
MTEHMPGNDTRLWCLHHIGPDDVHAAPDFATAQTWANQANEFSQEYAGISRFVVAVWPWTADDHAENLPRSIAEWTVPAASLPAASEGEPAAWLVVSSSSYPTNYYYTAGDPRGPFPEDWTEIPLYKHPAPSDQSKMLISELADALDDARNNGFGEEFFRVHVAELITRARQIGGEG